ncbi:MAG TPA: murein biosynthesis integral membrane protein MurJ [Longimicrobiaceae bacterium]|nr:murein biosynthesis integral membrane protein MurJ [Longimicrobiaceae bacterium]
MTPESATPPQDDETAVMAPPPPESASSGRAASAMVASGILLSRVAGLVRESVLAMFFGTSLYADVFRVGLRMPNVLQNLLGEGTLSASFIPVYAELLEQGREKEAGRVAGAIFALLLALASVFVLLGVLFAPLLVSVFLPGFEGERRALAIVTTRILFPMTGILVLSAWALGILNSHRRFFVPYVAPVLWNVAIIASFFIFSGRLSQGGLLIAVAWGALIGGALQFLVQLPWVLRLERSLRLGRPDRVPGAREAVRNAGPAIMGRGVVQLAGYVDMVLASLLAVGAVAAIGYAQTIYLLPVSLFGMSVAAAELPELSRRRGGAVDVLRERTNAGMERVAFFVVPSFVAFLAVGDLLVAALFQRGEFDRFNTLLVYFTLAAYSLGLLASTGTRLFSSAFFALRDTRTPARFATARVGVGAALGMVLMLQFEGVSFDAFGEEVRIGPGLFGDLQVGPWRLGAVGLGLAASVGAWLEWILLRRRLRDRIGPVGAGLGLLTRMFAAALAGAAAGWAVRWALPEVPALLEAALVVPAFAGVYFGVGAALGLGEAGVFLRRVGRVLGRR